MNTFRIQAYYAPLMALAYLCSFMLMPVANANVIGTQTMLEENAHQVRIEHVQALLAQQSVQDQMISLGVDPADAQQRVASLTDEQLMQIQGQLEDLPAGGGVLVIIGAVFLVLLILELVGVINIFNAI